jgi:hypothetical protein
MCTCAISCGHDKEWPDNSASMTLASQWGKVFDEDKWNRQLVRQNKHKTCYTKIGKKKWKSHTKCTEYLFLPLFPLHSPALYPNHFVVFILFCCISCKGMRLNNESPMIIFYITFQMIFSMLEGLTLIFDRIWWYNILIYFQWWLMAKCGVWEFKCKINYGSFWSPSGIYTKRSI